LNTDKREFHLSRSHMLAFISGPLLSESGTGSALSFPPGLTLNEVEAHVRAAGAGAFSKEIAEIAQASMTGFYLFSGSSATLVLPPFPVKDRFVSSELAIASLTSMLEVDWTISIILVRLGAYAIGLCRGEKILDSKVGTGLVHGRHRQGGSSANRFRRHRQKQIEQFLIRVCTYANEHLGQFVDDIDYSAFGGARTTIELLKKQCPFLSHIKARQLAPLLDVAEPRQYVLETTVSRIWSSRVIQWSNE
jgi:peptide subunit release factor 1 (eRF1)